MAKSMNSDSDAEMNIETTIKTFTFSYDLHDLETEKTCSSNNIQMAQYFFFLHKVEKELLQSEIKEII